MKHLILSKFWAFEPYPHPRYVCDLCFGKNKWDKGFIFLKAFYPDNFTPFDPTDIKQKMAFGHLDHTKFTLPEGKFQLIKNKDGQIWAIPGEDKSDRILAFLGCSSGFRGGISILRDHTTANILIEVSAGNALESRVEVAAIFSPGDKIVFHSTGRRHNEIIIYEYTREGIKNSSLSKEEFDAFNSSLDGEVL